MIKVYLLRLFRRTVRSKHCAAVGKHVCTYQFACTWLSPREIEELRRALSRPNPPRRTLKPRD